MRRIFLLSALFCALLLGSQTGHLQETIPVPTLVPPTPIPVVETGESELLLAESGVATILRDNRVRIGILYNASPFAELNIRGELTGFDADLGRAIAETWAVDLQFVQVTRQNAFEMLRSGQIEMLIAAQVHRREADMFVEFSQTYYVSRMAMMVRSDDGAVSLMNMANRPIGYVAATPAETALRNWQAISGFSVDAQPYLTLDKAYVALAMGEIDGVVDTLERLKTIATQPDLIKFLEEPLEVLPYAVVMRRQDINLRNLVNRTLQFLSSKGTLETIHNAHFPGHPFVTDVLPVWVNVGAETPKPANFGGDVSYPSQYIAPKILSKNTLRVAGLDEDSADANEGARRVYNLNRALVDNMAAKWGVPVEYIPNSNANALDLVASGQADLAVGVQPDWNSINLVDFSGPYLLHGDRLMVESNSQVQGFNELRNRWIAIMSNDTGAEERAQAWADSIDARINIYTTREDDIARAILVEDNADVAYGDILKLIAHLEANPGAFKLTQAPEGGPRWYSRVYMAFAVPRNDIDFRLLVDYTLQEFIKNGTLSTLVTPLTLAEETPVFDVWPGSSSYLGFALGS